MNKRTLIAVAALLLIAAGAYLATRQSENVVEVKKADVSTEDHRLVHIEVVQIRSSDKGDLPIIEFNVTGTAPRSGEVADLDLIRKDKVGPSEKHSYGISKDVRMGMNEIDLNTDTTGLPKGHYELRIVYSDAQMGLAGTTVAGWSDTFEIK